MIAVCAGGVGAAKFLAGLVSVVDPGEVTAVVNTGDDTELHGLYVSPDLDTVTYTLAGLVNEETGWGRGDETFRAMDALATLDSERTWFRLGDRDLGLHLYRTGRLAEGATLSTVTEEVRSAYGLSVRLLPMSDEPVRTILELAVGGEVAFQEYFVHLRHAVEVSAVRFDGVEAAAPAPGVLETLASADLVVIAPSNPVVSIGPILAVRGVRETLSARRDSVVAVSPIVGGAALKGPADRLLRELGEESSAVGVARRLAEVAGTLVIDVVDGALASGVAAAGVRPVVAQTVMSDAAAAGELARVVVDAPSLAV